jgi:ketosteroid isomerase-like protein
MTRSSRTAFVVALAAVLALGLAAAGAACGAPPNNQGETDASPGPSPAAGAANHVAVESLPPELDRVLRDYERAWRERDARALAELFAEDGFVLSDGSPPVRGRDAIRAAYSNAGGPLWLRSLAHATDGDVGYILGVYSHQIDGPLAGKFVLTLRRHPGGPWLIAADMDNSIAREK